MKGERLLLEKMADSVTEDEEDDDIDVDGKGEERFVLFTSFGMSFF